MEFAKHKNHRNTGYLSWIRKQSCIISGAKAQCAHHIRLGTNGGSALKPSDYFCIPLLNKFHTTGSEAIHIIGEASFFDFFDIEISSIFQGYLAKYLSEVHGQSHKVDHLDVFDAIAHLIEEIEGHRPEPKKSKSKTKTKTKTETKCKTKNTETEFYQKAKEAKRIKDKELRDQLKLNKPKIKAKVYNPKKSSIVTTSEYYQKSKEKQSAYRKEQYQKAKKRQAEYKASLQQE